MTYPNVCSIDWLSFTIPVDEPVFGDMHSGAKLKYVLGMVEDYPSLSEMLYKRARSGSVGMKLSKGRFPYEHSLKDTRSSVRWFFGGKHPHILVEISGQACQVLGEARLLELIARHTETVTRIDIAVDVLCNYAPSEILDTVDRGRFRTTGDYQSDSGHTVYVGSQKSQRYARVYRWDYPHPRWQYLRYEMVVRKKQAQTVALSLLKAGIKETAARLGNAFGWSHPSWELRSSEGIPAYRPERTKSKSERWFYAQVVPAINRMISEGILTRDEIVSALGLELPF